MYTAQDLKNYVIARKIKDDPVLPRGNSSGFKPKMIELDRNVGHNRVMSIYELFIDRDDTAHLVDQVIHDVEGIGNTSAEETNQMGQFFTAAFSVNGYAALWVSVYMTFMHG